MRFEEWGERRSKLAVKAAVLFINRGRIVVLAKIEAVKKIAPGGREGWLQLNRAAISIGSCRQFPPIFKSGAEIVMHVGGARIKLQSLVVTVHRLIEISLVPQSVTQIVVSGDETGIQRQRPAEGGNSRTVLTLVLEGDAEIVFSFCKLGI